MCERIEAADSPAEGLSSAMNVIYNNTGDTKCFNAVVFEDGTYLMHSTDLISQFADKQSLRTWSYQVISSPRFKISYIQIHAFNNYF